MPKPEIGICGYGWVGKAQHELFPDAKVYDKYLGIGSMALINCCDITFIAVPTPNRPDGSLDISAVQEVVEQCESEVLVIRSTVNPGDADKLKSTGKRIVTMPEYLGESPAHPMSRMSERQFMILGGDPEDRRKVIEVYQGVYNANVSIRQVTNLEAEVIKLSENRAIMYKVMQCQELYDACEAAGVDYYTVRDAVYGDDPRFNLWFTFVYPDRRGADSSCIPKDVKAWAAWAGDSPLTDAALKYNERLLDE